MTRFTFHSALLGLAGLLLSACALIPDASNIRLPKLPSLPNVGEMLGSWPDQDQASDEDPTMPFNSRGTLGYGQTMRVDIYQGTRSSDRIYRTVAMIDERGVIDLDDFGSVKVGGLKLPQARRAIEAVFNLKATSARAITVHIISVENVGLVQVTGDVLEDEYVPVFEGMRVSNAVTVAGGRKLNSSAQTVYLTRQGERRFFRNMVQANSDWTPKAGDIVTLSPDI